MKKLSDHLTKNNINHKLKKENGCYVIYGEDNKPIMKEQRRHSVFFVDKMLIDLISEAQTIKYEEKMRGLIKWDVLIVIFALFPMEMQGIFVEIKIDLEKIPWGIML